MRGAETEKKCTDRDSTRGRNEKGEQLDIETQSDRQKDIHTCIHTYRQAYRHRPRKKKKAQTKAATTPKTVISGASLDASSPSPPGCSNALMAAYRSKSSDGDSWPTLKRTT